VPIVCARAKEIKYYPDAQIDNSRFSCFDKSFFLYVLKTLPPRLIDTEAQ